MSGSASCVWWFDELRVETEGCIVVLVCTCGYSERQTEMYRIGRKLSKRESGRER